MAIWNVAFYETTTAVYRIVAFSFNDSSEAFREF